ncbi:MAG TPA: BTAD domain-containing putative transcriptional regulator [Candidatus Limnocylindrales bacterium]
MSARLDLQLLGDFRAEIDGETIPRAAWRQGRSGDLVKLLGLAPRRRLSRDDVIEALWPGVAPDAGGASVRKAVHFARRALRGEPGIGVARGSVELWPLGAFDSDVERFEAASARALVDGAPGELEAAIGLYGGELLPDDRSEPWTEARRRGLADTYARLLRAAGRWSELVELDPTDEAAHRGLMRAQLESGNRQAAIRQFERLREVLRDELGVGPDPESVSLYERVLAREGQDAPTPAERARALLAWGMIHWKRNDLDEAERTALEARALAVDAGLGAQVGEASSLLASIGVARGQWRNFLRDELLETVRRTPDVAPFVFDSNLCFTEFCLYLPDGTREMASFADELTDAASSAGSARAAAHAELIRGETELLDGHLDEAEATLRRAAELHRRTKTNSGESLSFERLAEVSTARGQRWKSRRLLESALRLADGDPLGSHLLVKIQGAMVEAAADPQEAVAVAAHGERVLSDSDVCQQCSMSFRMAAARAFTAVGDLANARRHLDEAARVSAMWQGGPWPSAVADARAGLEAAAAGRGAG